MTHMADWLQHRMSLLEIAGPVDLAEHADLAEETIARVFESNEFESLNKASGADWPGRYR